MKYILTVLFLSAVSLTGCKAPKFFMGMTEREFLSKNRVEMVKVTTEESIYRKVNHPFGKPAEIKFFYFDNGKLTRVDEGVRRPDIIIQNNR